MELTKYIEKPEIQQKFIRILGEEKKETFVNNLVQIVSNNSYLANCNTDSIVGAALISANIDLPINNTLGYAYIVPYGKEAQFQIGYKGLKQLALRTGNYKKLNVQEVFDGELIKFDRFTENYDFSGERKKNAQIIGYMAYMQLNNGFEKTIYWTTEKVREHGKKFSKTFAKSFSSWQTNFEAMAKKTVLKHLLSNWGDLSITDRLSKAIELDQSVLDSDFNPTYSDNPTNDKIEINSDLEISKKERVEKWNLFKKEFNEKAVKCKDISELTLLKNNAIFQGKSVSENPQIKNILNSAYKNLSKNIVEEAEINETEKDF